MKWFLLAYTFITTFALTNSLHIPYSIRRCNKNKFQIGSREVKKEYKNIEFDQFLFKQVDDIPKTLSGKAKWVEVEKKN